MVWGVGGCECVYLLKGMVWVWRGEGIFVLEYLGFGCVFIGVGVEGRECLWRGR